MDRMKTLRKTIREAIIDDKLLEMSRSKFYDINYAEAKELIASLRSARPTKSQWNKIDDAVSVGKLEKPNNAELTYFQAKRLIRKAEMAKITPEQMKIIEKGISDHKLKWISPEHLKNMSYKKAEKLLIRLSKQYMKDIKKAERALRLPDLLAKAEKAKEILAEIQQATGKVFAPLLNAFDNAISR